MISSSFANGFVRSRLGALLLAASALAAPALAHGAASSADYFESRLSNSNVPRQLSDKEIQYYRDVFAAIHSEQWEKAQSLLAERDNGVLHAIAKSELYLAANSPRVELGPLLALLSDAPEIPQAPQLGRLAERRGATILPDRPVTQQLISYGTAPRRGKPRGIEDGSMPASVQSAIHDAIVNDDPASAESALREVESGLTPSARAEWRQRVAWSYYIENQDARAYTLAMSATDGVGPWVGEAWWVAGLSAWRQNDCRNAASAFDQSAASAASEELRAAAYYWASRAHMRCRAPQIVQDRLARAAQYDETLYGMLALEALGEAPPAAETAADFTRNDWQALRGSANVRAAIALSEIGEEDLADEVLRHQARLSDAENYQSLIRLARDLSLPQTQIFLSHYGPAGGNPLAEARYPSPKWQPVGGWRVDPSLVYAHALQESVFRTGAVSPAGAYGLMQVRPGTARDMAAARGMVFNDSDLTRPEINLEYGQSYLEQLRDMSATQGLLPKVMAAYNAGPTPVERWNAEVRDEGDPLLYMESLPYWETRAYVGIIMRNYWMYERQAKVNSVSRLDLAQGKWPLFPGSRTSFASAGGNSSGSR